MTALQATCQVAAGALCGMKLHPVAITDISRLGGRNYACGSVMTCQRELRWDSFDMHENLCTRFKRPEKMPRNGE